MDTLRLSPCYSSSSSKSNSSTNGLSTTTISAATVARNYVPPNAAAMAKNYGSQYKGVVPQHNGKWGAQIYISHHRIWLGTFSSEIEAGMAYDRACLKFRKGDGPRNLLSSQQVQLEQGFLEFHTDAQVIQMLKDHSYSDKFNEFVQLAAQARFSEDIAAILSSNNGFCSKKQFLNNPATLFEKEVTPSDVGKLNRLVIPKQHAEKNFPQESQISENNEELVFRDENNQDWKFRYSFWRSTHSYVLTRGWSKFVRDKGLEAGDIVSFKKCTLSGMLYINVRHKPRTNLSPHLFNFMNNHHAVQHDHIHVFSEKPRFPCNALSMNSCCSTLVRGSKIEGTENDAICLAETSSSSVLDLSPHQVGSESVKLFGVEIGKK